MVRELINKEIKDFPVRHPEQRNVVTNISVADPETDEQENSEFIS
jgi:hypothetical protein